MTNWKVTLVDPEVAGTVIVTPIEVETPEEAEELARGLLKHPDDFELASVEEVQIDN